MAEKKWLLNKAEIRTLIALDAVEREPAPKWGVTVELLAINREIRTVLGRKLASLATLTPEQYFSLWNKTVEELWAQEEFDTKGFTKQHFLLDINRQNLLGLILVNLFDPAQESGKKEESPER